MHIHTFSTAVLSLNEAFLLLLMSILNLSLNSAQKWSKMTSSTSRPPRLRSQACERICIPDFFRLTMDTFRRGGVHTQGQTKHSWIEVTTGFHQLPPAVLLCRTNMLYLQPSTRDQRHCTPPDATSATDKSLPTCVDECPTSTKATLTASVSGKSVL
jgi:hypothetical protein